MTAPISTVADVLATYDRRMKAIEARNVGHFNYVLSWGDGRYVGIDKARKPFVTGFEHAAFFGDRIAANTCLNSGLTDGRGDRPHVINAFNAKQGAMIYLQGIIDMVRGQSMLDTGEEA